MGADDVVVINQGYELRTSKSGKQRFVIKVTATPLIHKFDAKELGRGPAQAIAAHFRQRIVDITAVASKATIKARQVAARAVAKAKPWALQRYGGGRIGLMAPDTSDRLFNDSGRLAKSLVVNASGDDAWRVNIAANRLSTDTASLAGVQRIFAKLIELVPEIGDPSLLLTALPIRKAITESKKLLITRGRQSSERLSGELAKVIFENAVRVFRAVDSLAA